MFTSLASGAKSLGLRFSLTGLLPFALLTVYFFGLYAVAFAPPGHGVIVAINSQARQVGLTGLALLIMVSIVLAVVSQPFQIGVVRLLEGYWGASAFGNWAREFGVELQRRRRHVLQLRRHHLETANRAAAADYVNQRLKRYPTSGNYLPTVLGNTLRAGEESAGERYHLVTTVSWPRLYYQLPEALHRDVADLHQQIDGGARLALALGTAGVTGMPVLVSHGWWNAVWISLLALAVIAYRGAVSAAVILRPVLESAYDLHRFDMLEALHVKPPANPAEEAVTNRKLSKFWATGKGSPISRKESYAHPKTDDGDDQSSAATSTTSP
jgi:hypothetical protein